MIAPPKPLPDVLKHSPTQVLFGAGQLSQLGRCARDIGGSRVLLVTDPGIARAGHVARAVESLTASAFEVSVFDGVEENPTTEHVARGVELAQQDRYDLIVGLGGGSAMDCAKGINMILTNGGSVADYWGVGKTTQPMLPFIAVPTTAGTGSEAQSFALICDPDSHQKMACGDRRLPSDGGLRPRVAILDPELTCSQPPLVAAAAGMDALAHAVETAGTTARDEISREFSRLAWHEIEPWFETAIRDPGHDEARSHMILGAHLAGAAIERSMLGAAHACANPLTAHCGLVHGAAVGLMLPHVIQFNSENGVNPYQELDEDADRLARRIRSMNEAGGLPRTLSASGVDPQILDDLAVEASKQWTATFNPRKVGIEELLGIYRSAYE